MMSRASEFTYFLNLENVTWDDFRSLNLEEAAIAKDDGLQCKSFLQLVDDRTCLEFLDKSDSGVEEEKGANDTEINPILKTGREYGGSLRVR